MYRNLKKLLPWKVKHTARLIEISALTLCTYLHFIEKARTQRQIRPNFCYFISAFSWSFPQWPPQVNKHIFSSKFCQNSKSQITADFHDTPQKSKFTLSSWQNILFCVWKARHLQFRSKVKLKSTWGEKVLGGLSTCALKIPVRQS